MSERDKKLLVYLGALIILAAAYFLVGKPYLDKIDALSLQETTLNAELSEKQLAISKQEDYQKGIDNANEEIEKIISMFPEDNSEEKSIMFVVNAEKNVPMWIANIQFAEDTQGMIVDEESASDKEQQALEEKVAANDEDYEAPADAMDGGTNSEQGIGLSNMVGRTTQMGLTYTTSYEGFKNLLAYVRDYEDRLVISDLNATYNPEFGTVSGNMILSQYALLGPGRELPEVETNIHGLGLKNIFSSRSTGGEFFSTDFINQDSVQTLESEDYYVKVNAVTNNTHGITIGRVDDVTDSTTIVSDENGTSDVEFVFTGKEGSYKVTYSIGDQSFMDGFGKDTNGKIKLRVVSTRRTGDDDKVAIKLHVTNESDIPLDVSIEGEDREVPRIDIVEKNGEVSVKN